VVLVLVRISSRSSSRSSGLSTIFLSTLLAWQSEQAAAAAPVERVLSVAEQKLEDEEQVRALVVEGSLVTWT
jgi:hypothetical protein